MGSYGRDLFTAAREYNLLDTILERLSDGTIDEIANHESISDGYRRGFELDAKVDGRWYHVMFFCLQEETT